MLRLDHREFQILIENVPTYGTAEGESARQFDREIQVDASTGCYTTSRHSVTTSHIGERIASVILLCGGGASGVHQHSAIVIGDDLVLAVGDHLTRLALPTLETRWTAKADEATCFGVYYSPAHRLILSHGELEIAALRDDGTIAWSSGGADIFTNGFSFDDNSVYARDFHERDYTFDIATGAPRGGNDNQ